MTFKEAEFQSRKLAKDTVRRYFQREGIENFNWDMFGLKIVKKELYHSFKLYTPHWDIYSKTYCVIDMEGNIVLK
jgi:hypothetical protein